MGDGIRPKGAKSYAAMRSPEAMKAHQKDIADEPNRCPKCGGEMDEVSTCMSDERALAMVEAFWAKAGEIEPGVGPLTKEHAEEIVNYTRERNKGIYVCKNPNCGHEEKVD
jgi:hypothetical protein